MWISVLDWKTNWYAFSIEELNENYLIIFHWDKDSYELEAAISTDEEGWGTIIVDLVIDDNIKSQLDEEYTYWFWESPEEALKNLAKNISPIISAFEDEWILKEVWEFSCWWGNFRFIWWSWRILKQSYEYSW